MERLILTVMLTTAAVMLQPGPARAEGVIRTASGIIEEFHSAELELLAELSLLTEAGGVKQGAIPPGLEGTADRRAALAGATAKTLSELKSIGIAETTGPRRALRIYGLIDSYTGERIESVRLIRAKLPPNERERMDAVVLKLVSLREARLKELDESLKAEAGEKHIRKPVPVMDGSPYEGADDNGQGMWYR